MRGTDQISDPWKVEGSQLAAALQADACLLLLLLLCISNTSGSVLLLP